LEHSRSTRNWPGTGWLAPREALFRRLGVKLNSMVKQEERSIQGFGAESDPVVEKGSG